MLLQLCVSQDMALRASADWKSSPLRQEHIHGVPGWVLATEGCWTPSPMYWGKMSPGPGAVSPEATGGEDMGTIHLRNDSASPKGTGKQWVTVGAGGNPIGQCFG